MNERHWKRIGHGRYRSNDGWEIAQYPSGSWATWKPEQLTGPILTDDSTFWSVTLREAKLRMVTG